MNNMYNSKKWKLCDPIDRAQLLLVIKGLKPGTTINTNNELEKIILENELAFQRVNESDVFDVAKSQKSLTDWNQKLKENQRPFYEFLERNELEIGMPLFDKELLKELNQINKLVDLNSYRIRGEFYGYPSCCIEQYLTDELEPDIPHKFYKELKELSSKNMKYSHVLDYSPPSFTPCEIQCPNALKLLELYKQCLDALDIEAANQLTNWNQKNRLL